MKNYFKPNSKFWRKVLLAVKTFGASLTGFFLATGKNYEAAVTGVVIGGIDMLVNIFSDGTNEILKESYENNGQN